MENPLEQAEERLEGEAPPGGRKPSGCFCRNDVGLNLRCGDGQKTDGPDKGKGCTRPREGLAF